MNNKEKILRELYLNPTYKFHLRELSRKTKLNPNTILNITDKLKEQGFIIKQKHKNIVEIFLNIENPDLIFRKKLFNLFQIHESGIIPVLIKEFSPKSISLIGSYSRGEDIEKSDIDIVIISENNKLINLSKFEKKLNRRIHLLTAEKEKMSKEFLNNLINGIVLYGAIKL